MPDRTATAARAVVTGGGPSPATGKGVRAPTRELAQRQSGTAEVLLLWHPAIDRVEVSVHDLATGVGFRIDVPPGSAIDAFYHPYAYEARRENPDRLDRAGTTIVDG
jgi:hypothetical protein